MSPEAGGSDVVAAVESLLAETIRRPLSMTQVAERMYTTERSLRRRLAAHGHRFEELRGRVRRRRAEFLLERTNLPVTRIAEEVGYQDPREFRRAFVRWTGETPTARRRRAADTGRSITQ
ncbi:helix-turn-helix domain-containing protein [Nocardia sp. NPDC003693]